LLNFRNRRASNYPGLSLKEVSLLCLTFLYKLFCNYFWISLCHTGLGSEIGYFCWDSPCSRNIVVFTNFTMLCCIHFGHPVSYYRVGERIFIPSVFPPRKSIFVMRHVLTRGCVSFLGTSLLPNVVVKRLTTLLCIWKVRGSNLGPDTGYPD
jgi:hypothetical protein